MPGSIISPAHRRRRSRSAGGSLIEAIRKYQPYRRGSSSGESQQASGKKRQRAAALQDLSGFERSQKCAKRLGVRLIAVPELFIEARRAVRVFLPAASVNNSAAKILVMSFNQLSHNRENTHRPATNYAAGRLTPQGSPSSQAMRWSLTNTQWRTTSISRSHYKPFAWIGQRVFLQK